MLSNKKVNNPQNGDCWTLYNVFLTIWKRSCSWSPIFRCDPVIFSNQSYPKLLTHEHNKKWETDDQTIYDSIM